MKTKISLIIVLVFGVCLVARGQVQPKDLPEATSLNDADIMITQQESDDKVRKFDFQFFKDQVLYWQTNGNFAYTFDSIAIGKSTPGEFLDVDGNIKADTIKGYINVKGNNDRKIAYFDADSVLTSVDELSYDGSVLEFDTETFFYTKASFSDTTNINYSNATDGTHEMHVGRFGRNDTLNYGNNADTWVNLKFDTVCGDITTSGYELAGDSSGIIVNFTGRTFFSGHAHVKNNGNQQSASIYVRLMLNSEEQTCFNTAETRAWNADAFIDLTSTVNVISVSAGDTLRVEYRSTSGDFDLESTNSGVFDNTTPFNVAVWQSIDKN